MIAKIILNPLRRLLKERGVGIAESGIGPEYIVVLAAMVECGAIHFGQVYDLLKLEMK